MTFFFRSPPTLIPKRNGKTKTKKNKRENSYYYYYNTIFFLKDCCILRKDQKPCCLKESPPVCAREVSSECSRRQAHPSLLPLHHAPSSERRLFTSNPVIVPAGEGDILTSSRSFLLLWKIKVKKPPISQLLQHLFRTCFSHHRRREGREGTEQRCSLNFPAFMNNFSMFSVAL